MKKKNEKLYPKTGQLQKELNPKTGQVQYDNTLNNNDIMDVRWMTNNQLDLLFTLFSKVLDRGDDLITIPIEELKKATLTPRHNQNFKTWVTQQCLQIVDFKVGKFELVDAETGKMKIEYYAIFPTCKYDPITDTVQVRVNPDIIDYFNSDDWKNFTMFELKTFVSLKTTYPKHMYRLIKSWKTKGHLEYSVDEFKNILGIPATYTPAEITRKVINPIKKEFADVKAFENFEIKTKVEGRKITEYQFKWKPENPKQDRIDKQAEKEKAKQEAKEIAKQNNRPNEDELAAYIKDNNLIGVTAKLFIAYYDNKGWNGVNNWQAVATTWSERVRAQMEINKDTPMPDWYYQQEQTPVDTETLISIIAIQFDFDEDTPEYDEFIMALHKLNDETGDLANDRIAEIAAEIRQKYSA